MAAAHSFADRDAEERIADPTHNGFGELTCVPLSYRCSWVLNSRYWVYNCRITNGDVANCTVRLEGWRQICLDLVWGCVVPGQEVWGWEHAVFDYHVTATYGVYYEPVYRVYDLYEGTLLCSDDPQKTTVAGC